MDWGSWTTPPCGCCKCCRYCKYMSKTDPRDPLGWADYIFTGATDDLNATSSLFEAMAIGSTKFDSCENEYNSFDSVPYDYGRDYSDPWWEDQDEGLIQNSKGIQPKGNEFDYFDSETTPFGQELDKSFVSDWPPEYKPNYGHTWASTNSIEDMIFSGENNNVDMTSSFIEAICSNYDDRDENRVRFCNNGPKWHSYEYEENSFGSSNFSGLIDALLAPIDALVNFISDTFGGRRRVNDFGTWGSTDISSIPTIPSIPDKIPSKPDKKKDDASEIIPKHKVYEHFRKDAIAEEELGKQYSEKERDALARGDHASAAQHKKMAEHHNIRAENLHKDAAKKTVAYVNRENDQWKLDLHGLKVAEAIDECRTRLKTIESDLTNKKGKKRLEVVTGKGKHSPDGVARIRPAVKKLLNDEGYDFELDDGEGAFLVQPKF